MFEGLFSADAPVGDLRSRHSHFGPKKLPELGKGIGEGIRGFKSATKAEETPEKTGEVVKS